LKKEGPRPPAVEKRCEKRGEGKKNANGRKKEKTKRRPRKLTGAAQAKVDIIKVDLDR